MPKGQKKTKGTPELYNEVKKQVNLSLTPTAVRKLDNFAKKHRLSRSELIEQIARGSITLARQDSLSEKFVFYRMKSISFQERNSLPETMGAFLVSDLENFAYVDSCSNLKKRFDSSEFINELKMTQGDSSKINSYKIFWIESDDSKTILKTQNELIWQFRLLDLSSKFSSMFTCVLGSELYSFSSFDELVNSEDKMPHIVIKKHSKDE